MAKTVKKVIDVQTDVNFKFVLMDGESFVNPPDGYTFVSVLDKAIADDHLATEIIEFASGKYIDYDDPNNELPLARLSLISLCQVSGIKAEDVIEGLYNYVVFMELSEESYRKLRQKAAELKDSNKELTEEIADLKRRKRNAKANYEQKKLKAQAD